MYEKFVFVHRIINLIILVVIKKSESVFLINQISYTISSIHPIHARLQNNFPRFLILTF